MKQILKKNLPTFILSSIAILGIYGCVKIDFSRLFSQKPQAPVFPPQEVGVLTLRASPASFTKDLPGRLSSFRMAEVRPQVDGILLKRFFQEGGDVKQGDSLYQIDPEPFKLAVESAKAALAKAKATFQATKLKALRYKVLVKENAVSKQDYDDIIALALEQEADVSSARASLDNAIVNLNYTKVLSPITGRIGRSLVTEGALLTAQQTNAIAIIQQLDPIYVDISQSSVELLKLKKDLRLGNRQKESDDAKVELILEDGTPYPLLGTLEFSEVTVDSTTGSVIIRALFPNPNFDLLPGMFVRAKVRQGTQSKALLVPQHAVSFDAAGNANVFIVNAKNQIETRKVKLGQAINTNWVALSGLKNGEKIVVEGLQKVKENMPVVAQEIAQK